MTLRVEILVDVFLVYCDFGCVGGWWVLGFTLGVVCLIFLACDVVHDFFRVCWGGALSRSSCVFCYV